MDFDQLEALLTVGQVADMHDVPARVVRKAAKNKTIPGAVQVLGKWGFDADQVANWTPPEPGTRVSKAAREDGRRRFTIYLTTEEAGKLVAEGYEMKDPREVARARRAARKAKQEEAESTAPADPAEATEASAKDDPFSDFG